MSDFDRSPIDDTEVRQAYDDVADLLAVGGVDLADDALWVAPEGDIEDSIMAAIADDPVPGVTPVRSIWSAPTVRWLAPLAAAAAIAVAFVTLGGGPDWTVALASTDAAPGASAIASGWNEENGTRVELAIEGLDPAPDGFVYELWFSADDVHISAGTFHGTGEGVTLWAGVGRADFPRIWVTLEPIDNDPAPGVNVLDTAALDG